MRWLWFILIVAAFPGVRAGAADAPEIADAEGDCAIPYGNAYLDIVAAWIDAEEPGSFDVHLRLAAWNEAVAEGAGLAVQFEHQGVSWGAIGFYSAVLEGGWSFFTGQATLQQTDNLEDAKGSFDAATGTMTVAFPKSIFPHDDPGDTTLRSFVALSVDARPAYPFLAAQDAAATDPDGRWLACDEATSDATYAFAQGGHSADHAAHADPASEAAPVPADAAPAAQDAPAAPRNEAPAGGALVLAALAAAARMGRR